MPANQKTFKAKFYKAEGISKQVSEPLESIIARVSQLPLQDRTKSAGGHPVRLEDYKLQNNCVLMNLAH